MRLLSLAPKASASANFAIPANKNYAHKVQSTLWPRIFFRHRSKIPRPQLAVFSAEKTSLRFAQELCGHKYFSAEKSRDPASASSCLRLAQSIPCLVRPEGIEPSTLSLRGICSTS